MKSGEHKDIAMPFGKHKGALVCDLEDSYILWLKDQDWLYRDWPELAKQIDIENKFRNTWKKE